ncbi:hypothetical protein ACSCB1_20215 [Streptomyces europaeiscabiei]|uniref:Uncharacterized protein n=1 Tax=Streptomyces europaeiscabiei TaxID=146819 RepID=A0ABU4ND75_9ACTN|nr:hypothetical protein [Streptomyces europaeiscabiei]MDX2526593.1 hypothetical protein [Streptomyces europaeiscabiei]MDX2759326.1 hypothetical protein [Streptomyces europaeiscabiei]MDX2769820.1 hypothetical protein [Streptomyces europaeiscabiei]MDX3541649.1 hypothetical protein [Streptomyces europaeiscabiei]MDX3551990.1 hypothetical protein [Streptomyces europaeiscabiei]
MTNNEGEAWGGVELDRAEAELRQVLAVRMQRAVPADLVVTTRTEIEKREFEAYGQGWRDRGEHEDQRRRSAAALRSQGQAQGQAAPPRRDPGGKILPFPQQTPPPVPPPHPHPHPPTARQHPSDDDL